MRKAAAAGVLAFVFGACASGGEQTPAGPGQSAQTDVIAQSQKSAFDPAGTYDFATAVDGTQVSGNFEIARKDDGSYGGRITSAAMPEIPITRVTVNGNRLTLVAVTDGQPITMELTFTGDTFTGTWAFADGSVSGAISGKKTGA